MKKLFFLLMALFCLSLKTALAQDIDSLYQVFESSRGEASYRAAVAVDKAIGREPNYNDADNKDDIKVDLLRTLILYFYEKNDFQHVLGYSEIGIAHYNEIGDLYNLAGCYMTMANAYQRLGQLDKAIDSYNQCSSLMDQIGGDMAVVNKRYVMNNIAEIYLSMGEYDNAESMYQKCVEMLGDVASDDTTSNLDMATYCQNLAEVRIARAKTQAQVADVAEAVAYAERSLDLSQRYGDTPHKIINRMTALSKAYFNAGRTEESLKMMDDALQIAQSQGEIFFESNLYLQRGQFEAELGNDVEAADYYAKAIAIAEANHFDEVLQEAYEGAYLLEREVNPRRALEYFEKSVAMKDSIFNENQQQLIRDYQVRYATQEKENELLLQQEKAKRDRLYIILLAVGIVFLALIALIGYRLAAIRKKRNEELKKLNETKDHLFSIVSHDVKTPVGAMCQVLRELTSNYDSIADTDRKADLVVLHSSAEALNDRMDNIIQWVKGELANSAIVRTDFNLSALVDECLKSHEAIITAKSLKVSNEVPSELVVNDDANVVGLVLHNLLSNALKFSYPNGEVHITAEQRDDRVWVAVADNGMGISEKKLDKIFRYMTSSATGTGGETGTGIGLFVSKQLVDKIDGEITIESRKDVGTTVQFSIKK